MYICRDRSANDLYRYQLNYIVNYGQEVLVRGLHTKELLDVATIIEEPARRVHIVPGRKANPFLAMSEALWMMAGRDDVAALLPYNKRILEFSDDGHFLYGAYGLRMWSQIEDLIARLQRDPNDRRAVLSIWRKEDLTAETRDAPCNDMVMFKLRSGLLHMTVFNRSNDLHWGLYAVNLCQFSVLQEYLASRLGASLGFQTHISNSLHIYQNDHPGVKVTERMLAAMGTLSSELPPPAPLFRTPIPYEKLAMAFSRVLDGELYIQYPECPWLEFACDYLQLYRGREDIRNQASSIREKFHSIRHAEPYADWLLAALEFFERSSSRGEDDPEDSPNDELRV